VLRTGKGWGRVFIIRVVTPVLGISSLGIVLRLISNA
jgi:hypothetical protein